MEYHPLFLVLLPVIVLFLHLLWPTSKLRSKLPPGPKPWPIIGHIHLLGNQPHQSLTELSKIHGPIMTLRLGNITTIVISSPEIAKEMFLKHDLSFSSRQIPDSTCVTNHNKYSVAWLPVCPMWRKLRKIAVVQLFTNQRLDATQNLRRKKVDELVEFVRECCEKGVAVDIGKAVFTTSLNLLSNTIFSVDLGSHDSSQSQEFNDLSRNLMEVLGTPNVSDFFPLLKLFDLQGVRRKSKGNFVKMLRLFQDIDARLRDSTSSKNDVLTALLKLVAEKEMSLDEVKHFLVDLFVAGADTTTSTLEWAFSELIRHPEKMAKAQFELNQVISMKGSIQEIDIPKLSYIQAIVKETLRLHPAGPFLVPHKATEDVLLYSYNVPKNAQVWVNIWSIGRDQNVWPNPELFEPERFLESKIDIKGQDFELIPFGAGRRICPGMPLAYRMMHLLLANLVHYFKWKLADGLNPEEMDMEEKFGLSLHKAHSLQVFPYPSD